MTNKKQVCTSYLSKELSDQVKDGLVKYGKIKVVGLGIFQLRKVPSRLGRNPQTGEIMTIPEYTKIKFFPTKSLRDSIRK